MCIYPTYLNGARSIAEGRRVPREACPTNPTLRDIVETAAKLGLRMVVEVNKRHPRDPFTLGRVRVELKKEDGSLAGPIKSRASAWARAHLPCGIASWAHPAVVLCRGLLSTGDHLLLTIALALRNAQFEAAAANAGSAAGSAAAPDPTSPQPAAGTSAAASPASGSKQKKRK